MATGLILAVLALTSFDWWKHKLGIWWVRLHRLIYLAALLDLAHFFLVVKGNLLSLSGNITLPLFYAILILVVLAFRVLALFRNRKLIRKTRRPDDHASGQD